MPTNLHDLPPHDPRIAFFDRLAPTWDSEEQNPAETLARLEALHELLDLRPGDDLLEVGCGTGQLTAWLAERVRPGRVAAVDFAPEMIRKAAMKGGGDFRVADVCQDDLGRGQFDVAFCFHSFPHFRDQQAALRNLAGCMKPNGRLIVLHLAGRTEINAFHGRVGGAVGTDFLPSDGQWSQWLTEAAMTLEILRDEPGLFFLQARNARGAIPLSLRGN